MAPATSQPLASSMPSIPGDELTSTTTGPRLERKRSTPATLRPSTSAARSAVRRSSSDNTTGSALPPRCRLARNSPILLDRIMPATALPPIMSAEVVTAGFLDVLLHEDVHVGSAKRLDDGFGRGRRFRQDHAAPLRALEQLDDAGRATDLLDHIFGATGILGKGGDRQANALARQQLQRAQLVARSPDGDAFIEREDALNLELAQHRDPVVGDGRANARDHRVIVGQQAP